MKFKYILFDLDGTLTDPQEGITNCVKYALEAYGIKEDNYDNLLRFIGPPIVDSFMGFYGKNKETAKEMLAKYRERFSTVGLFENRLFDGVTEMLENLKKEGKKLAVATCKPEEYTDRILKKYGIYDYFDTVVGSIDEVRVYKKEIIELALSNLGAIDKEKAVMVGDREYDIVGAKQNKISSVGVKFGYAKEGELEEAGADFVVSEVLELEKLLLS